MQGILDTVFGPLLVIHPLWSIILISFVLSLVIVIVYKYATDQSRMKTLKETIKQHQASMKEHKNDPQKALEFQKKAMEANLEMMKHSFKPTLITMLPIIILFSWLSAHYALEPIRAGQDFTVFVDVNGTGSVSLEAPEGILVSQREVPVLNNTALFTMNATEGDYILQFVYQNATYEHKLLVTKRQNYHSPLTKPEQGPILAIRTEHKDLVLLNLFGWQMGWIWTYILFSIGFSIGMRKLLKVH